MHTMKFAFTILVALQATLVHSAAVLINERACDISGFDISTTRSSAFWSCMKKAGYGKVNIRAYQQACSVGGEVDSGFLKSYKAAKAAGFTCDQIDAYFFPCKELHLVDTDEC